MQLSGLFIYPVKSLRACAVAAVKVDELGLAGDRRFMVVDENGRFVTQRTIPRMALIGTALDAENLTLTTAGAGTITVARQGTPGARRRSVSIWKSEGLMAEDCGDDVAAWISDFLGLACRLVRIGDDFSRPIAKPNARPEDRVSFADSVPALIVSEASLADLNDRLASQGEETLPMDRFRPNLVVTGCAPFAEDDWPRVRIGEIMFRSAGPCPRCVVTTTDQSTAERGREPLRTLAKYRRDAGDPIEVNFGQNLIHETKRGVLRVGDLVTPHALPDG